MEEKKLPLIKENSLPKDDAKHPKNIDIQKVLRRERLELFERINKSKKNK